MISRKYLYIYCIAVIITRCHPAMAEVKPDSRSRVNTQIVIGGREACLTNPPSRALESAFTELIPLIGGWASERVQVALAEYIAEILKKQTNSVSFATRSGYLYRFRKGVSGKWTVERALECITIARGRVGSIDEKALAILAPAMDPKGRFAKAVDHNNIEFPALKKLGFGDFPELYIELALDYDSLSTVFRLSPRVVYFRKTSAKPTDDGTVNINIMVAFSSPGRAPLAVLPVRLPSLQIEADLPLDKVSFDNPWAPLPPAPTVKSIPEEVQEIANNIPAHPINVSVTVEETGKPNRFISFLGRLMISDNPGESHVK